MTQRGVRVWISDISISNDYGFQCVTVNIKARFSSNVYDNKNKDYQVLQHMLHNQGGKGLWLSLDEPKTPAKNLTLIQVEKPSLKRHIHLDD